MNCPICGAPLGATDNECKNCGTRRAEMGAAYNNQQNGYGYGGNTMNGGQGYGNYGMNNGGSGYGNYGMNSSFGNDSLTRTRTKSFSATNSLEYSSINNFLFIPEKSLLHKTGSFLLKSLYSSNKSL